MTSLYLFLPSRGCIDDCYLMNIHACVRACVCYMYCIVHVYCVIYCVCYTCVHVYVAPMSLCLTTVHMHVMHCNTLGSAIFVCLINFCGLCYLFWELIVLAFEWARKRGHATQLKIMEGGHPGGMCMYSLSLCQFAAATRDISQSSFLGMK